MYGAGAAWSRLFYPGAGADPSRSEPESAPGPWPPRAGAAQKSGGSATLQCYVNASFLYVVFQSRPLPAPEVQDRDVQLLRAEPLLVLPDDQGRCEGLQEEGPQAAVDLGEFEIFCCTRHRRMKGDKSQGATELQNPHQGPNWTVEDHLTMNNE